uniref:Uncharacterized protein n=1 Tax=Cynoglossus semilaevis TaxID=244447 RepID=A0A3P8X312_CYNSE
MSKFGPFGNVPERFNLGILSLPEGALRSQSGALNSAFGLAMLMSGAFNPPLRSGAEMFKSGDFRSNFGPSMLGPENPNLGQFRFGDLNFPDGALTSRSALGPLRLTLGAFISTSGLSRFPSISGPLRPGKLKLGNVWHFHVYIRGSSG